MNPKEKRELLLRNTKCNLILDAALSVFSQKGYYNTRLEDIACAAGFTKSALYYYYQDKEEIFINLGLREFSNIIENSKKIVEMYDETKKIIEEIIIMILKVFGKHFPLIIALSNFKTSDFPETKNLQKHIKILDQFKEKQYFLVKIMNDIIERGKEKGEIKSKLGSDILGNYILSLVRGILYRWWMYEKMEDVNKEVAQVMSFLKPCLGFK